MNNTTLSTAEVPLVNFLGVGVQKGGTTALDQYLRQHPQLCLPSSGKELHYFDNESIDWSHPNIESYHSNFSTENNRCDKLFIFGEVTPIYFYWNHALERAYRYNPKLKLILFLRDPFLRAYAHWNMEFRRGFETLEFMDALKKEEIFNHNYFGQQHRVLSYLQRSFYSVQLKNMWDIFPQEQTLVLKSENLLNDPLNTMNRVFSFLGVDELNSILDVPGYQGTYTRKLHSKEFTYMFEKLSCDIRKVEKMLNWNCTDWFNH